MKSNRLFAVRQQSYELKQAQKNQRLIQAQTNMKKALRGENIEFNWDMICQFSECFAASCMLNPEFHATSASPKTTFIPPSITFSKKTNWMLLGATLFLILQNTHAADLNSKVEVEIPMDPSDQAAAQFTTLSLPSECKHHKLIKGNPYSAKTLLFGQVHGGVCKDAEFQCMNALAKGKSKKTTTVLLESFAHGKHAPCEDPLHSDNPPWIEFADTCQGWNWPQVEQVDKCFPRALDRIDTLNVGLDRIRFNFEAHKVFELSGNEQFLKAAQIIKALKRDFKKIIDKEKQNHINSYKAYKARHPNLKEENFSSDSNRIAGIIEGMIQVWDHLINIANVIPMSAVELLEALDNVIKSRKDELAKLMTNMEGPGGLHDIQAQNQFLAKSVRSASKQFQTVFVQAGDVHVNPSPLFKNKLLSTSTGSDHSHHEEVFEIGRQAVFDLYKDLDQFADENPYAVLSCTLEPDLDNIRDFGAFFRTR